MPKLTLFEALIVVHFIMDWLFQTRWEAMNKTKNWLALLVHSSVYTIGFIPIFFWYQVNFWWLLLIFLSHAFFDRRSFEFFWLEKLKGFKREETGEPLWWILLIGIDQTFHLAILAIIVFAS